MKVSVAMCTYNGTKYLKEQLDSILGQTLPPDEIVITDDCSSDGTADLAEQLLSESGISYKVIINEKNSGVRVSFGNCIRACSGDVIFTADQDDVWDKEKIRLFMDEFENDESCVFVFSNGELVDADLKSLGSDVWTSLNLRRAGMRDHISQEKYRQLMMYYWAVPGTMMAFKRSFMEKAFPIPEKGGWLHDSWLAINAPAYGKVVSIDKPLTLYRQHGKNTVGVKAVKRSSRAEDKIQMQKVLFYLKRHGDRLSQLLERNAADMPADYRETIESYIKLFRKYQHYENDGKLKKIFFLLGRLFDGGLEPFDISRGNVVSYLLP